MINIVKRISISVILCAAHLQQPTLANDAEFHQTCYLNKLPEKCWVNIGHMKPISKGNDIDIYWKNGRTTTIKLLDNNWGPGGRVLLNGKSRGKITSAALRNGTQYKVITTDNGMRIDFAYGD